MCLNPCRRLIIAVHSPRGCDEDQEVPRRTPPNTTPMRTSATAALRDLTQIRFCPIRTFFFPRLRALLVAFYHAFSRRQVEEGGGEEPDGPAGAGDNAVSCEEREHSLLSGLAAASHHRRPPPKWSAARRCRRESPRPIRGQPARKSSRASPLPVWHQIRRMGTR